MKPLCLQLTIFINGIQWAGGGAAACLHLHTHLHSISYCKHLFLIKTSNFMLRFNCKKTMIHFHFYQYQITKCL